MDMTTKKMLFDFSVGKEYFNELRDHIIEHLKVYKIEEKTNEIGNYLTDMAENLEPKTHCCECTPGERFQKHTVHIQYPDCKCDPNKFVFNINYVLKRN